MCNIGETEQEELVIYKDPIEYLQKKILAQMPRESPRILLVPDSFCNNLLNDRKDIPEIKAYSTSLSDLFNKEELRLYEKLSEEKVKLCENKQRNSKDFLFSLLLFVSVGLSAILFVNNYAALGIAVTLAGVFSSFFTPLVNEPLFTTISNYRYWLIILREAQDILDDRQS